MEPGVIAVAFFSLLANFLLVPPLVWHIRNKNVPAACLIVWLFFINLRCFINILIWSGEQFYEVWDGKGYCDVVTFVEAGSASGKLSAIAALALNLYMVLRAKNPIFLEQGSRKKMYINLAICLITPLFVISTFYLSISSRYAITRYQGCVSTFGHTYEVIFLYLIWAPIWAVVGLVFSGLTLFKYFQKRKDVGDLLKCSNSNLDLKRFARLLIFSILVVLVLAPLSIFYLAKNIQMYEATRDYISDRTQIIYYDFGLSQLYDKYINIALSFLTFFLFGIGSDAITMYKRAIPFRSDKIAHVFNLSRESSNITKLPSQTRTHSNKSYATDDTGFASKSTMNDINLEYSELMSDFGSPYSNEKSKIHVSTYDLERDPSDRKNWSPSSLGDLESRSETTMILNEGVLAYSEDGFGYNFQVRENDPKTPKR